MEYQKEPGAQYKTTGLINGSSSHKNSINGKSQLSTKLKGKEDLIRKAEASNSDNNSDNRLDGLDLFCFCHLRWDFVFQRPQHLLTRFAKKQRVFYFEEPIFENTQLPYIKDYKDTTGVHVFVPMLPHGKTEEEVNLIIKNLVDLVIEQNNIENYMLWYYTPMSLPFSRHLQPKVTIYDCMDELSLFHGAPKNLLAFEEELMKKAEVMFTGGMNLYEYKKEKHKNVHGVPSSIDRKHFENGMVSEDPADQKHIGFPRAGFYGVVDERMNIELLSLVADKMPDWNFIIIGPVVKINPETLPKKDNIHYLGGKNYQELPAYLGNWDVALLPFALNESTRFISPTKTPEYLSALRPVVSTPITDVVKPYGDLGLVEIADDAEAFSTAIRTAYAKKENKDWLKKTNEFLCLNSWDRTQHRMYKIISETFSKKDSPYMNGHSSNFNKNNGYKFNGKNSHLSDPIPVSASALESKLSQQVKVGGTLMFDYMIVGAGFAGSVLAERLAKEGKKILILDKRNHIGGNAYDCYNEDGILIHKYGPHIFHTNSAEVFDYLGQFTKWRSYEHRVLASVDGSLVPIPINLDTINELFGYKFNASQLEEYFESVAEKKDKILTSEDVVVSKVGRELYEKFFRGYTRKQWGMDPSELNASVTSRVPTRTNRDNRYFTDTYQAMPLHGYTEMFKNMLSNPNIRIMLNTDYKDIINIIPFKELIYTGPIDEFFNFQYGKLPYRSLEFVFETHDMNTFQKTGTVNYPNEHGYTRISEFKYMTGQIHHKTSIVYEYPKAEGDPYYPVPKKENNDLYKMYEDLAKETRPDVHFVGRLATYKYYNMDQVVAQALSVYKKIKKNWNAPEEEPVPVKAGRMSSN